MKREKKLLVLMIMFFISVTSVFSQPPMPNGYDEDPDFEEDNVKSNQTSPIGTATLLMLGLGGAVLGYKIKKNSKNNE